MSDARSSSSSENKSTSALNSWRSSVNCKGAEPKRVSRNVLSLGNVAMNFSSKSPAGVVQLILPFHQFSIKRFLPFADTQIIERLLNQSIRNLRVRAQPPRRRQLSRFERPRFLPQQQTSRQARFPPC